MRVPKPWFRKADGCWYVTLSHEQVKLGPDREAAFERYFQIMATRGQSVRPGAETVRDVLDRYINWAVKNLAESTVDRRRPILQSFGLSVPDKLKARDLKPHHVQSWIDANPRIKSGTTANGRIGLIQGAWNWAVGMGLVDRNPLLGMKKPPVEIREVYVSHERWPELIELARDREFRDVVEFLLETGARVTELFKYEAQHFDGLRLVLPIAESKGKKRNRVVYLSPRALEIISRLARQHPEGPLFRNSRGRAWTRSSVRLRFQKIGKVMKIKGLCATAMRHSFSHHRLSAGQDAVSVSKLLSHVDTQMLARRYSHLEENEKFMVQAAGFGG